MGPQEKVRENLYSPGFSGCREEAGSGSLSDPSPAGVSACRVPQDPGAEARRRTLFGPLFFPSLLCLGLQKQGPRPHWFLCASWSVRPPPWASFSIRCLKGTCLSCPFIPGQALSLGSEWVPPLRARGAAPEHVLAAPGDFSLGSEMGEKLTLIPPVASSLRPSCLCILLHFQLPLISCRPHMCLRPKRKLLYLLAFSLFWRCQGFLQLR